MQSEHYELDGLTSRLSVDVTDIHDGRDEFYMRGALSTGVKLQESQNS